ncbi:hypothetical protein CE91St30_14320 [Raoultibacter timonensis]|uniref:Uncharacterized protein n=1 Tax=Raoultibacter timonensis TaxID=1907662 RepID=A0ABM7WIJ3_9ACTN|nr:hypothetical protein CE91St30_14320 [Raoultibacter timonensis]BDF50703.1 hypothetical protein CE91St31_14330 [Raoultibacter timonensis]
MLGNAISVEFGNAISVEGAPWKVRPGRYAAGSSRPRRFAAEIAPGPGIATGNAAAIRETRPEAPDLEESGASGGGTAKCRCYDAKLAAFSPAMRPNV